MPFSERDWTHLRRVHAIALERFCARVLDEAATIAHDDRDRSAYERYRQLFRLVQERDAAMATAFDDLRRSTGLQRLSAMIGFDVLTEEDLAGFKPEVRDAARELSQILGHGAPQRGAATPRRRGTRSSSRDVRAGAAGRIAETVEHAGRRLRLLACTAASVR